MSHTFIFVLLFIAFFIHVHVLLCCILCDTVCITNKQPAVLIAPPIYTDFEQGMQYKNLHFLVLKMFVLCPINNLSLYSVNEGAMDHCSILFVAVIFFSIFRSET